MMKINKAGLNLIKEFEGCRLKPYKALPSEPYYTLGIGHYGADTVKIYNAAVADHGSFTEEDALNLLEKDVARFDAIVNKYCAHLKLNSNQHSALVSFTYNCGAANLAKLIKGRDKKTIGEKILLYNKAGGKTLKGLVRRREAEQKLYKKAVKKDA